MSYRTSAQAIASAVVLAALACTPAGAATRLPSLSQPARARTPVVLNAINALSATDAWAVGSRRLDINTTVPWAQRWDGTSWQHVPTADPGGTAYLRGVDALSAADVWAVGNTYQENAPVTEHWDGAAWVLVSAPGSGGLASVSAVGPNDVWAVGRVAIHGDGAPYRPLALHWDGTAWSAIPTPDPDRAFSDELTSVSAISADDVWAVGENQRARAGRARFSVLIEHWDGTSWTVVPHPHIDVSGLSGVVAVSPDDVWAVGSEDVGVESQGLTEHWNGHAWSVVPPDDDHAITTSFSSVSGSGPDDVWAVGETQSTYEHPFVPHIEHWDGSAWSTVSSTGLLHGGASLTGVSAVSPTSAFAVGGYVKNHSATLLDHWDGSSWSVQEG